MDENTQNTPPPVQEQEVVQQDPQPVEISSHKFLWIGVGASIIIIGILLWLFVFKSEKQSGQNPAAAMQVQDEVVETLSPEELEALEDEQDAQTEDTDGDGLSDAFEVENGLDPEKDDADQYLQNVLQLEDEDGDGLSAGVEQRLGTDPKKADTDGDGLSDSQEFEIRTDPLNPDTDGDGFNDGQEVEGGFNPNGHGSL